MSSELVEDAVQITMMAIVMAVVLLFLGVVMLVILHVCVVGRAFRRRGFGINPGTFDTSNSSNQISMSLDDIQKLPCYNYIAKEKGSGGSSSSSSPVDCVVCLENFKMGEKCRQLPLCKHSFHAECVDSWLLRNPICPVCRTTADSGKAAGLVLGEESREVIVELRENQSREDIHLDEVIRIQLGHYQIGEGSHVSE